MGYKVKLQIIVFVSFSFFFFSSFSYLVSTPVSASEYGITNTIIFSKILDNAPYLDSRSYGSNYFLTSDEDENFYVEASRGFYKYDKYGNFVCATYEISGKNTFSNLIYLNNKIYTISKSWPYYFNIYSSLDCSLTKQTKLYLNNEAIPTTSDSVISNITLSKDSKYIAFFSYYLSRIYVYSIADDNLLFDQVKTSTDPVVILKEFYTKPPQNLGDSKFFAVNQSNGEILVFDYNNISTFVSAYGLRGSYQSLRNLSTGGNVPHGFTKNNLVTSFNNYLCIHPLINAQDMKCIKYIDQTKAETPVSTPIISDITDENNNVYLVKQRQVNSSAIYSLNKYSGDVVNQKSVDVNYLKSGGLHLDGLGNIVTTSDALNIFDKDLNLIVSVPLSTPVFGNSYTAVFNNVLGANDYDVPAITPTPSANLASYMFPMNLYRASAISQTYKNNFYIYQEFITPVNSKVAKIYKFKGQEKVVIDPCPLKIYCNTTPKHRPVILIHGLGGSYKNWFDEKTGILRTSILDNFHIDDKDFPNSWVHSYSYGYNFNNDYNYQGKIEDISSNLHFDVDRLSQESKAVGGDGKVDLIGYSLGGLVARHYILEKTGYPGTQNLDASNHNIGKLILIASPVNGSSLLKDISDYRNQNPKIGERFVDFVNYTMSSWQKKDLDITKDVGEQLNANSTYLNLVKNFNLPSDIKFYRNYANIVAGYNISLFGKDLKGKSDMGDIVVKKQDTILNNANFTSSFLEEKNIGISLLFLSGKITTDHDSFSDSLRFNHLNILEQPELVNSVINQLLE